MRTYNTLWQMAVLGIGLVMIAPASQARKYDNEHAQEERSRYHTPKTRQNHQPKQRYQNSSEYQVKKKAESSPRYDKSPTPQKQGSRYRSEPKSQHAPRQTLKPRSQPKETKKHRAKREHDTRRRPDEHRRDDKTRTKAPVRVKTHEREAKKHHSHTTVPRHRPHSPRPSRTHERHYKSYSLKSKYRRHYHRHETYHYHTHYLAPIRRHYHTIGHRIHYLPRLHISFFLAGIPYFYFDGVFYRHHHDGYIVVSAPVGAVVTTLPVGFISFHIGGFTYYYVNNTYYRWDDELDGYIVVRRPSGADKAIAEATTGRLYVYPKEGQTEELQAKDRYECHRWAVHETDIDPTLDESDDISDGDHREYKRAITACLEGRGYSVK